MLQRLVVGFRLVGASARIVRHTPVLLVPGLVQTAALGALLALVLASGLDLEAGPGSVRNVAVLFVGILVSTVVGVLSGAVVVAITADRLDGGQAGLREGAAVVARHLPQLLVWSLLSATVGTVLRLLEERLGPVGRWITSAVGVAFSLGTVLVIPVIVLERERAVPALRRSATLFRARFGEVVGGETGLALALSAVFLVAAGVIVPPLFAVGVVPGLIALGVLLAILLTVSAVLSAVFSVAVHRVATDRPAGGPFGDLTQAFRLRGEQFAPSYSNSEWDAR